MNDRPIRGELLERALAATCGDRNKTYGEPLEQFTRHAELCSAYFGRAISPHDVAIFLILCKLSRIPGNPAHEDSYIDGAAYFAIAGELAAQGAYLGAPTKMATLRGEATGKSQPSGPVPVKPRYSRGTRQTDEEETPF